MHFLSWGDFTLPFQWGLFVAKHLYMWSFQSGTSNPDGLIRLPGRLVLFLVFGLFGNVGASYLYIFGSLAIAFVSFFLFARKFLQIKHTSVQIIAALFFALNPVFLGNVAKIGLVLAAAMLPFCLLALRATFQHQKFRFLLLYILCLNISFLHPYTFVVNLGVSLSYAVYLAWNNQNFVRRNIHKFALIGVLAVVLNLYFVLPTMSMGTVSKDVISTNITPTKTDYTALVDISNTGNIFTGLSLSKNVFVDFAFYNNTYQNVYFFGMFTFYVILFGVYLRLEPKLRLGDKRRLGVFFTCFLVLIALATVSIAHLDTIIKILIGLPGGWAFRSPLKWQLYIPLPLFSILAILLNRLPKGRRLVAVQAGLLATFVIINSYLAVDIFKKILTPRTPGYFAGLQATDLEHKTVLFTNNGECMTYMRENPAITTELNQVFASKNAQLKHVIEDEADTVNLGSYDYVLGCKDHLRTQLEGRYDFRLQKGFGGGTFHLYANRQPLTPLYVTDRVFTLTKHQEVGNTYNFVRELLNQNLTTATTSNTSLPASSFGDAFESLSADSIHGGVAGSVIAPSHEARQLYIRPGSSPLYMSQTTNSIGLSATPGPGLKPLPGKPAPIALPAEKPITIAYRDNRFDYKNLVPNASLEQGLWQQKVGDCYNYDSKPVIAMRLSTESKTDGKQALELDAQSHIACSGPKAMAVVPGEHYLLSFDYQNARGLKTSGYHLSFDDPLHATSLERMQSQDNDWHTYGREIVVPANAHHLQIDFYAYPDSNGNFTAQARYDRVVLQHIPLIQDRFYVVGGAPSLAVPQQVRFQLVSPTRKLVHITGAAKPFYLGMNETYDKLWQVEVQSRTGVVQWPFAKRLTIPVGDHLQLNDTTNGWYIDPAGFCTQATCHRAADGSYSFDLVIEFVPQRWFYFGAAVSGCAFVLGVLYYIYDRGRGEEHREGLWRWRK